MWTMQELKQKLLDNPGFANPVDETAWKGLNAGRFENPDESRRGKEYKRSGKHNAPFLIGIITDGRPHTQSDDFRVGT